MNGPHPGSTQADEVQERRDRHYAEQRDRDRHLAKNVARDEDDSMGLTLAVLRLEQTVYDIGVDLRKAVEK